MSWDGRGVSNLAQHHARVGYQLQEKGDLEGALRHYDRAVEEGPGLPGLLRERGWLHYQRGDFHRALSDLDAEIDVNPEDSKSYECRARVRLAAEDAEGALKDSSWLVARYPDHPGAYSLRGFAFACAGTLDRALDDCSFAVEIDSRQPGGYVSRGWVRLIRGELGEAKEDAGRALSLDRRHARASELQARLDLIDGKLADASERFEFAARQGGLCGWAEYGSAMVLHAQGRWTPARDAFEAAYSAAWGDPVLRDYARLRLWSCDRRLGEGDRADRRLDAAMTPAPSRGSGDWTARISGFLLGRSTEEDFFRAASARTALRQGRDCQVRYYIGLRKRLAGDADGARRAFQDCLAAGQLHVYESVLARAEVDAPPGPS